MMSEAARDISSESQDYERIARAIEYIRCSVDQQPSLAEVATAVGLSEYHLQRLFSRWAGVSPKRFLQVLTVEYAKELLDKSLDLLTASHEIGLSGSGRLHDLFINLEAMSPGEYKSRGAGIEIRYGFHPSPLGDCFVGETDRGICCLEFVDEKNPMEKVVHLADKWKNARLLEDRTATRQTVERIFCQKEGQSGSLSLLVKGTNFQVKVWSALLNIPPGHICSYSTVANWIGHPGATRAVGTAVGANPVALLIPCHRVLRGDGQPGGYHWGLDRKYACLIRESTAINSPSPPT